jgi:hypothetical protein
MDGLISRYKIEPSPSGPRLPSVTERPFVLPPDPGVGDGFPMDADEFRFRVMVIVLGSLPVLLAVIAIFVR